MKWFIVVLLPFELCSKANLNKHGLFTWWKESDCISAGYPHITTPLTSSKTASEGKRILGIDRKQLLYCKHKQKPKQIFPNNVSSQKMFQSNCWLSKIFWTKTANHKNPNGCSSTWFCIWCRLAPALARAQYTGFQRCKLTCGFPSSCPDTLF